MKYLYLKIYGLLLLAFLISCNPDNTNTGGIKPEDDLRSIDYNPTSYTVTAPKGYPAMVIPSDNPLTLQGIELGRMLFYDPILSADSSMSCSSCHQPAGSFTDNQAFSKGIRGINGKRSAMSLLDVAYVNVGLFWDGRSKNLEDQALHPVEDPIEMDNQWGVVVNKLKQHDKYPAMFRKAFGIQSKQEITKEYAAKSLASFMRIIVSSGKSKYDRFINNELFLSDDEFIGKIMFFDEDNKHFPDAQCGHCHAAPTFFINEFRNNGMEFSQNFTGFEDPGRGAIVNDTFANGLFRVPTLRNIAYSAPFMHNGTLRSFDEVMDHYMTAGQYSPNRDPFMTQIHLNATQKNQVIAFLKTLTDTVYMNNPMLQNPFK